MLNTGRAGRAFHSVASSLLLTICCRSYGPHFLFDHLIIRRAFMAPRRERKNYKSLGKGRVATAEGLAVSRLRPPSLAACDWAVIKKNYKHVNIFYSAHFLLYIT